MWNSIFTSPRFRHTTDSPRTNSQRKPGGALARVKALTREDGVTLIEFVPALMVFLLLTFAIFDFARLFFVELEVQTALQEAARYGSTGNHLPDPNNPGNTLSRITSIIDTFNNDASGLNVTSIVVSSQIGGSGSAGGPGDMLTVSVTVKIPLTTPLIAQMFPGGQYSYTASTTVMNEPFLATQTN